MSRSVRCGSDHRLASHLVVALDTLPGDLRHAYELLAVEALPMSDAADRLGIATAELEQRLALALSSLAAALECRTRPRPWRRWLRRLRMR